MQPPTRHTPCLDSFASGLRDRIAAAKRAVAKDELACKALELDLKEGVDMVEHAAHAALAALLVVRRRAVGAAALV